MCNSGRSPSARRYEKSRWASRQGGLTCCEMEFG